MFSATNSPSSSSKHQPSFLVFFLCLFSWLRSSSFHPTKGEQPFGKVRARLAAPTTSLPWPGPSVFCGTACWASLQVETHWCPCAPCEGDSSRLYISYRVTELHLGPASSSVYSQRFVSSRSRHPHCQDLRCWACFSRHTPETLIRSGCG